MRYTKEQISTALLLLKATGSPNKVIKTLGYPSSPMLYHWRDMYPEYYDDPDQKHWKQTPNELKQCIIKRCILGGESVKLVAEEVGYTPSLIYKWIREYGKKGHFLSMKKAATNVEVNPSDIESAEDINALKAQMFDMQMEIDILKETINVLKKDPGIDQTTLANREKAVIIDALKNKYALPSLCKKPDLAKSSYYYQEKAIHAKDKYLELRKKIVQLFHDNRNVFGYRKIHTLLRMAGIIVSEKVVRRIMKQESLIVKQRHRQKYNSYKGEITPAVENVINRDFHADKPNQKWLTDITEAGLTRSMSKKGFSPDNSACEGFFGHLKTEMFYGRNWDDYSIDDFIQEIDTYIHWYCSDRIKSILGGLSPLDHRRSIGVRV